MRAAREAEAERKNVASTSLRHTTDGDDGDGDSISEPRAVAASRVH